jgi:hypothetical protein
MRHAGWSFFISLTASTLPRRVVDVRRSSSRARNCLNLNAGHHMQLANGFCRFVEVA